MRTKDLYSILEDLNKHHRKKSDLLSYYINKRLDKSLETYYKELSYSVNYLKSKNNIKVMGEINECDK